jgi:hypothetical protein
VIDLDRFPLYQALGLDRPRDSVEEKVNNGQLMQMLAGKRMNVRYRVEEDPAQEAQHPLRRLGQESERNETDLLSEIGPQRAA